MRDVASLSFPMLLYLEFVFAAGADLCNHMLYPLFSFRFSFAFVSDVLNLALRIA